MNIWQALVLGVVQGLCEFLPVSSSGHLVLFQNALGINETELLLDTCLHLGTLAALALVFYKDIWQLLRRPLSPMVYKLVIATIPAVMATLLFGDFFESAFSGNLLGVGFLLTAAILFSTRFIRPTQSEPSYKSALFAGVMQAIAILPGISRSGSTIAGGMYAGQRQYASARFAFLMAIPAILGSVVYQGYKLATGAVVFDLPILPLIVGTLAAAVSSLVAIRFMLNLLNKHGMTGFAAYTLVLGILILVDQYATHFIF